MKKMERMIIFLGEVGHGEAGRGVAWQGKVSREKSLLYI